jgi:hypothetical protein
VADMDPIWQFGYDRQVFAFNNEDHYPQEMYDEQEP